MFCTVLSSQTANFKESLSSSVVASLKNDYEMLNVHPSLAQVRVLPPKFPSLGCSHILHTALTRNVTMLLKKYVLE